MADDGIGDDVNDSYDELDVEPSEAYETEYEFVNTYMDAMEAAGYEHDEQELMASYLLDAFGPGESEKHSEEFRDMVELLLADYGLEWDWDAWRREMEY